MNSVTHFANQSAGNNLLDQATTDKTTAERVARQLIAARRVDEAAELAAKVLAVVEFLVVPVVGEVMLGLMVEVLAVLELVLVVAAGVVVLATAAAVVLALTPATVQY